MYDFPKRNATIPFLRQHFDCEPVISRNYPSVDDPMFMAMSDVLPVLIGLRYLELYPDDAGPEVLPRLWQSFIFGGAFPIHDCTPAAQRVLKDWLIVDQSGTYLTEVTKAVLADCFRVDRQSCALKFDMTDYLDQMRGAADQKRLSLERFLPVRLPDLQP